MTTQVEQQKRPYRLYLVISHEGDWPDGWHGLGTLEARGLKQAEKLAAARWPGKNIGVRSAFGCGTYLCAKRWLAEAEALDALYAVNSSQPAKAPEECYGKLLVDGKLLGHVREAVVNVPRRYGMALGINFISPDCFSFIYPPLRGIQDHGSFSFTGTFDPADAPGLRRFIQDAYLEAFTLDRWADDGGAV